MRLRFAGFTARGRAVDLRNTGIDARSLVEAIRDPDDDRARCRRPGPVHEHVGLLAPNADWSRERARAAAARSRGFDTPGADEGADAPPPTDPVAARRAVAAAREEVEGRREGVAAARGRLDAHRKVAGANDDPTVAEAQRALRDAARRLSEAETALAAANERLAAARGRARAERDARTAALRAADRRRNERRALAERVRPFVERAARAVPDCPLAPRLAVARAARVSAPLVLAGGPFERAARAAACLDAPVALTGPLEV